MRQSHRVKEGMEDFDVTTVQEMAEIAYVITDAMQALVAVIASLSLVVGGIGIMNIMLVSVTERTREIGLRMAVGATSGHMLTQFLIEAMVLSVLGGVVGVLSGLTVAAVLAAASAGRWSFHRSSCCWRWAFPARSGSFSASIRRGRRRGSTRSRRVRY